MSTTSIVLSALLTLTLVILIAPSVLALNRGKILRNIALWLAIVLALALVYQNFGPSGKLGHTLPAPNADKEEDGDSSAPPVGEQGYTPPKEE